MPLGGILNVIQVLFPKLGPTGAVAAGSTTKAIVNSNKMPAGAEKVHWKPGWKRFGNSFW